MRFQWLVAAAAAVGIAVPVAARSEFDNIKVVDNFSKNFLFPNSLIQAHAINSTLFSEDVRGTVDGLHARHVTDLSFDGRELNTEYMFGLFARLNETGPSFLGTPVNYTVNGIMSENDNILASVVFDFHYPYIDEIFPLELITFFTINEAGEISEYSTTFRRWSWASDIVLPKQVPAMAKYMNITDWDDDAWLIHHYMSHQTCVGAQAFCHGDNKQYQSYDDCMHFLTKKKVGEMYRLGDDNLACRFLHVGMLELRPSIHCDHVGPSGGDMCIARDYDEVVRANHFLHGFIAPAVITPENRKLLDGMAMTAGATIPSLLEISMSLKDVHSWDATAFTANVFWLMALIWLTIKLVDFLFHRLHTRFDFEEVYEKSAIDKQRDVVMYCVNIFFITVALALLLATTPALGGVYELWMLQLMRFAALTICSLYMFELVFRWNLQPILIAHRLLTIFITAFAYASFEYCQSPVYLISLVIWLIQSTTDQIMYLALLGDTLKWDHVVVSQLYKIAAVQTGIFDIGSIIALVAFWAVAENYNYRPINAVWTASVWISALCVLAAQTWGSYVLWKEGEKHTAIRLGGDSSATVPLLGGSANGSPRTSHENRA